MKRIFLIFSVVFTVVVLLMFTLFQTLNHVLLKKVTVHLPYSEKLLRITSASPTSIHGYFFLREQGQGGAIPHFAFHYNITDLLAGVISEVVLDSANFDVTINNDGAGIAHFPKSGDSAKTPAPPAFPVAIKKLVLQNCMLRITAGSKYIPIDVTGSVEINYEKKKPTDILADFEIKAQGLLAELQLQSKKNAAGYEHTFSVTSEDLSIFRSFIPEKDAVEIAGKSEITGIIKTKEDFTPLSFDMDIAVTDAKIKSKQILLATKQGSPCKAGVQFDGKTVHASVQGLELTSPLQMNIIGKGQYILADRSFAGYLTGEESVLPFSCTFSGNHDSKRGHLTWKVEGENWDTGSGIKIIAPEGSGNIDYSKSGLQGDVKAHIQSITIEEHDLALKNIDFRFAKTAGDIPGAAFTGRGTASVGSIDSNGMAVAAMKTEMKVESDQMLFTTEIQGISIPKLNLACSGNQLAGAVTGACFLPETTVTTDDFLKLTTVPDDVSFSGRISGRINFHYSLGKFKSSASFQLQEADVSWGEDGHISNIATTVTFSDLPSLSSSPRQLLEIERMNFGKFEFENVKINYRVDRSDSLFVERIMMNWCGGRVETAGIYLDKDMTDFSTTLFCDRIGYTDLLGQLGIGAAEGNGSLNGRLPIAISKDGVYFDDGFLFSTPGESGILRFSNTDMIRKGMPAIDQAAYLEYSLDALRNFSYNWTKLRFNTEKHNLLLALQLAGQPVSPLPYGYKDGKIVKKTVGKGIQHPIRLDVNFRFPTEDIFRYSKSVGSIMEKMK